jgi:hypothetical protein
MTEAEWLACKDPVAMLDYVRASASPRKLRLLACACCRRVWEVMKNRDSRKAVAVAERFADSQAADAERKLPGSVTPTATLPLAQAAYDERILPSGHLDNARLAVLSDALEEAGCTDADLLAHLRTPGPHVRGCWALDHILGKS